MDYEEFVFECVCLESACKHSTLLLQNQTYWIVRYLTNDVSDEEETLYKQIAKCFLFFYQFLAVFILLELSVCHDSLQRGA